MVRIVAPTICWASLGTKERAFLMKCTRQRCHEAPCRIFSRALLSPRWASLVTSLTPERPRATRERRKAVQNSPSSLGPTPISKHLPLASLSLHADGDHHRHRDHAAVLAGLDVGGVDPDVRLFEMPPMPRAFTSSSTFRVETPRARTPPAPPQTAPSRPAGAVSAGGKIA